MRTGGGATRRAEVGDPGVGSGVPRIRCARGGAARLVRGAWSVFLWDLQVGLRNRLLRAFGLATLLGGALLPLVVPGAEALPSVLVLVTLFFGPLFAVLVGWASGQQARAQGPLLFAQPVRPSGVVLGKWAAAGVWCAGLVLLGVAPGAARFGAFDTLVPLAALAVGLVLVFALAGLTVGLVAEPVAGLLAVLFVWGLAIAGWEIGLAWIADAGWLTGLPELFVVLVLANPAGAFRVGALVGLEIVPLELGGFGGPLRHSVAVAAWVFVAWAAGLYALAVRMLGRQEL